MEPLQLFEQLYSRFKIRCPPNALQEELKYFDEWQKPIQRKYGRPSRLRGAAPAGA